MSVIQEGKKKLVRGDLIKQFEDLPAEQAVGAMGRGGILFF